MWQVESSQDRFRYSRSQQLIQEPPRGDNPHFCVSLLSLRPSPIFTFLRLALLTTIYNHLSLICVREPLEMASAVSLPLKSIAFATSLILAAGGSRIKYRDLLIRTFTGPGSYSRTAVIALLLINVKNWPFAWTVRADPSHENRVRC
jgi:hypothetical protein